MEEKGFNINEKFFLEEKLESKETNVAPYSAFKAICLFIKKKKKSHMFISARGYWLVSKLKKKATPPIAPEITKKYYKVVIWKATWFGIWIPIK